MNRTVVYTDGACRGNPGAGGWGWIVPDGPQANGFDPDTTNQRMELQAVLNALGTLEGPVEVVSDSTYVVNCFRDGWWKGWLKRGWKNAKKEPVANRDIWEPLIELVRSRIDEIEFTWVKGHAGNEWNDAADRLAVEASHMGPGRPAVATTAQPGPDGVYSSTWRPSGAAVLVTGLQPTGLGGYDDNPISDGVRCRLTEILRAKAKLTPDLVALTGLRLGAETLAAEAAVAAGVPFVAILAFPHPDARWPPSARRRFQELLGLADTVVRLERKTPADARAVGQSLERRNGWMRRVASEAIVVWDGKEPRLAKVVAGLEIALPDNVWFVNI